MSDVFDSVVDRVVILGDPLTEPEVSESWVKVRAVLAIMACSIPGLVVAQSAPGLGMGMALGAAASAFMIVTRRINERIGRGGER